MRFTVDEKKYGRLRKFLVNHTHWPRAYHRFAVSRKCAGSQSARQKLAALFRSALSSNTGGGITKNAAAARQFMRAIEGLGNRRSVSGAAFLDCFGVAHPSHLLHELNQIEGVGLKKAALFVRDLSVTQTLKPSYRIVSRKLFSRDDLVIPLDRVIAIGLNQVLRSPQFGDGSSTSASLLLVNDFFRQRSDMHFMLIEDLWFWGFFGLVGTGYERYIEINDEKIALDPFFDVYDVPRRELRRFGDILAS